MLGFAVFLFLIWLVAVIVLACYAWYQNWTRINKALKNQAEQYDERHARIKEEEKKIKEKSKWNTSWYSLEDENVKKIYKELKTWKAIEDIAKDLKIKKGEVYDIQIFLEDEWML